MSWVDDLKQNVQNINHQEIKNRKGKVYGEKNTCQRKTLKKSYFSRPKLLTDWEYQKKKKNQSSLRPSRDIQVKQFSQQNIDYDKPWKRLKYEHKINRIIHFVKINNLDRDIKKQLITMTKNRKIDVEYENGEIKKILNLEEN